MQNKIVQQMKESMEKDIKDLPWHKRLWERAKFWANHSEGFLAFVICFVVWFVCLLPSGFFGFLWWLLDPSTFWQKLALLALCLPLYPFMFGGIVLAMILTVMAIGETKI